VTSRVLLGPAIFALLEVGCGGVGEYTSLTIGSDGRGLISYQDTPSGLLKVAHCENGSCSSAAASVLDREDAGAYTSMATGVDGLGLVSYQGDGGALKVAHCHDSDCASASVSVVDGSRTVAYTSIAIGRDGLGLISYRGHFSGELVVAHCEDIACSHARVTILDPLAQVGEYSSITIGSDGLGLIAYQDRDRGLLKVAHCHNTACTSATRSTIANGPQVPHVSGYVGAYADIAVGADGLGLISYYEEPVGNLRVAHCADVACTNADVITIVDRGGPHGRVGEHTSVAIGRDGLGLISYHGSLNSFTDQDLKVAHCQDVACRTATVGTLDHVAGGGDVGWFTSVTMGRDGLGLISYWSPTAGALRVAHCQNMSCSSASRSTLDSGVPAPATLGQGVVFAESKKYVDSRYGGGTWNTVLQDAGLDDRVLTSLAVNSDADAAALVPAAARVTGRPADVLLEDFGSFVAPDVLLLYGSPVQKGSKTLDVIERIGLWPPSLRSERVGPNEVVIRCNSSQEICAVAKGIARGLALHLGEAVTIQEASYGFRALAR